MRYLIILEIILTSIFLLVSIRNEVVWRQRKKIIEAIKRYNRYNNFNNFNNSTTVRIDYSDIESYDKTFKRFKDWGCKNILPEEKYNLIKSFIR